METIRPIRGEQRAGDVGLSSARSENKLASSNLNSKDGLETPAATRLYHGCALCVLSPLLVHEQLSVEVLMVPGVLDWVDEFLGFDELVTVPLQIVRFRHDTSPRRQRQTRVTRSYRDRRQLLQRNHDRNPHLSFRGEYSVETLD